MRVVLADDSVLVREGVARLLGEAGFEISATVGDAEELLTAVARTGPDVAIIDVRMPPSFTDEGLRAAETIRARHPNVGVLVLSQHATLPQALRLIGRGNTGVGYLLKDRVADLDDFLSAVRRVGDGGSAVDPEVVAQLLRAAEAGSALEELTAREREILTLIAEGRSNQAIATTLFLGMKTIETHIKNIFLKLDLAPASDDHRRVLAVLAYLRSP
ncbi:MAG: response regulator transcription factor [Actinobacteria bacterium]|nr:response regulator transcription factor [Actinomycetota bacterium]